LKHQSSSKIDSDSKLFSNNVYFRH